uniref:Secreted protein n=1 Tax=Pavo cristatus TaxID=9049 RepID=A0A8C9EVB9_PAVCR
MLPALLLWCSVQGVILFKLFKGLGATPRKNTNKQTTEGIALEKHSALLHPPHAHTRPAPRCTQLHEPLTQVHPSTRDQAVLCCAKPHATCCVLHFANRQPQVGTAGLTRPWQAEN